jgi:hypothetical protein
MDPGIPAGTNFVCNTGTAVADAYLAGARAGQPAEDFETMEATHLSWR